MDGKPWGGVGRTPHLETVGVGGETFQFHRRAFFLKIEPKIICFFGTCQSGGSEGASGPPANISGVCIQKDDDVKYTKCPKLAEKRPYPGLGRELQGNKNANGKEPLKYEFDM